MGNNVGMIPGILPTLSDPASFEGTLKLFVERKWSKISLYTLCRWEKDHETEKYKFNYKIEKKANYLLEQHPMLMIMAIYDIDDNKILEDWLNGFD